MATRRKAGRSKGIKKASRKRSPARPRRARREADGLQMLSVAPSFTVNDLERSIGWYRDVLGFKVSDKWEHDGKLMGVELAAGRVTVMLGQDDWKKGRDRAKGEGFRIFCTTSQDVDRIAERIKARGGTLLREPQDEGWGMRAFAIADPDGFKITIARELKR